MGMTGYPEERLRAVISVDADLRSLKKPAPLSQAQKVAAAKRAKERKDRILRENAEQAALIVAKRHAQSGRSAIESREIEDCIAFKERCSKQYFVQNFQFEKLHGRERRIAVMSHASVSWAEQDRIDAIYRERDRLNETERDDPWEVDHYYPILGKDVTGLHVPDNLRLMRRSENIKKSNKHPETL